MQFYLDKPIAHRGLHDNKVPENSLAAFSNAIEYGYSIELDVHLSSDDHVVAFHDVTLLRMTGSGGDISQYTLKSLKKLKLLDTDHEIPTLKEVLGLVDNRVPLIIELKCEVHNGVLESRVMRLLESYGGEYAIQCFNPLSLRWIRKNYPSTILGIITSGDFSKTKLNFFKKTILKYMPLIPIIRPDYVAMNYKSFNLIQYFIVKKLTHGRVIFWTIDNETHCNESKEYGDNIIFEGFLPKD